MEASTRLEAEGTRTRVVSLPCWEAFDLQEPAYRDEVLPPAVRRRLTIEAGVGLGWERWAGDEGAIQSIEHFGASAPGATVFEHFGFTVDRVTEIARGVARGRDPRPRPDRRSGTPAAGPPPGAPLMRIAFAADHGGAALKGELLRTLGASPRSTTSSTSAATAATRPTTIPTTPAGSGGRSARATSSAAS